MDESEKDVLAYLAFPAQHRTKLHSTNALERLNKEVKRRADGVGIFPSELSHHHLWPPPARDRHPQQSALCRAHRVRHDRVPPQPDHGCAGRPDPPGQTTRDGGSRDATDRRSRYLGTRTGPVCRDGSQGGSGQSRWRQQPRRPPSRALPPLRAAALRRVRGGLLGGRRKSARLRRPAARHLLQRRDAATIRSGGPRGGGCPDPPPVAGGHCQRGRGGPGRTRA